MRRTFSRRRPWVSPLVALAASAADKGTKARSTPRPDYIPFDDPKLVELLKKIDAAGAYKAPDLSLRKDENYAGTADDREPFSGTKPFKENFLAPDAVLRPRPRQAGAGAPRHA